ncbi:MAG: isopentenyl phosphate kinase family protein [Methanosarcinaceae archaeon]|nr:isopentenyl phosphate kinase family protein [Methanosarcinaceae archaeon]
MNNSDHITILKIGGSVITDKDADKGLAKKDEINRLAREISTFEGKLVIVHGAGSFGHPQAKRYSLMDQFDVEGAVITHRSVKELSDTVIDSLNNAGVHAIAIHPMNCMISSDGRIMNMFLDNIRIMLDNGLVPVLHGDVVMDHVRGTTVVSGDQIVPYLAAVLGASRIGVGSAEDGVLDSQGYTVADITLDNFDQVKQYIGASQSTDVTGGMRGKVLELLELCRTSGTTSYIFNAGVCGNVLSFLRGENIGTAITDNNR